MNLIRINIIGVAIASAFAVGANAAECGSVAPGEVCSEYLVALQNEDFEVFVGLVHSTEYAEWTENVYAALGAASEDLRREHCDAVGARDISEIYSWSPEQLCVAYFRAKHETLVQTELRSHLWYVEFSFKLLDQTVISDSEAQAIVAIKPAANVQSFEREIRLERDDKGCWRIVEGLAIEDWAASG